MRAAARPQPLAPALPHPPARPPTHGHVHTEATRAPAPKNAKLRPQSATPCDSLMLPPASGADPSDTTKSPLPRRAHLRGHAPGRFAPTRPARASRGPASAPVSAAAAVGTLGSGPASKRCSSVDASASVPLQRLLK